MVVMSIYFMQFIIIMLQYCFFFFFYILQVQHKIT